MPKKLPPKTEPLVYVLDSYALLAYLEGEAGAEYIKTILHGSKAGNHRVLMSIINLGEVLYITERERDLVRAQKVLALVEQLPIEIVAASREMVLAAAHIKARYPIAYADAFAVALAQANQAVVLTNDPEFQLVKDLIEVQSLIQDKGL